MPEPRNETERLTLQDVRAGLHRPPSWLKPKTILDLGCNVGYTLLDFRELFPEAEIWGVEMDLDNYLAASANVGDDSLTHIFHMAISDTNGIVTYDPHLANNAYTIGPGDQGVQAYTLDAFVKDLPGIDFAKIDIEGTERLVFSAGGEIWPEKIRSLKAELHGKYGIEEAAEDLGRLGYRVVQGECHELSVFAWR